MGRGGEQQAVCLEGDERARPRLLLEWRSLPGGRQVANGGEIAMAPGEDLVELVGTVPARYAPAPEKQR
jgi:hypothetical protein